MNFLSRFLQNHVLANLAFMLVLVLGILSYLQMPRARDPDINFNWINIVTILAGASAEEVESRITDPIEDVLSRSVKDIRFVSSTSRESISIILVRFEELSDSEFDKRLTDLQREVQNVYNDQMPEEAEPPRVLEITSSTGFPTATLVLTADEFDEDLRRYATLTQKALEQLPGVDGADMDGIEDPELHIAFYPERLDGLGITPANLADTVRSYFRDISVGDLETADGKWVVRLKGTDSSLAELENYPVVGANGVVTLGSLADIYRTTEEAAKLVSYRGEPAVMIALTRKEGANTLEMVAEVERFIDQRNQRYADKGFTLHLVDDQTVPTREALALMQNNALIGLVFVLLVTWVFLGSRIAFFTSIGIPFTLAGTFIIINVMGMSINSNVLLGIIIGLGMLVDDAVVVVEAIYHRMRLGADSLAAALAALKEVFAPVTTSVLTTMAVFLPLMLLPGILGEFMRIIPLVVCIALAVSLFEAYWILPSHVAMLRVDHHKPSRFQERRERFVKALRHHYTRSLLSTLRYPGRTALVIFSIVVLSFSALSLGAVKFNFFASDALRIFYVGLDMPRGSTLEQTLDRVVEMEQAVLGELEEGELRATVAYSGQQFTITEPLFGDNVGQVMVSLLPEQAGGRPVLEIIDQVEKKFGGRFGEASITMLKVEEGPPLGQPISMKIRGDDFAQIKAAVDEITALMEAEGIFLNVNLDFRPGNPELQLTLDGDAIKRAGLLPSEVNRSLQAYVDGELITQYQQQGEEVTVRLLSQKSAGYSVDALLRQTISRRDGQPVALGDLTTAEYGYGQQNIRHYNYQRTITIAADIDEAQTDTVAASARLMELWNGISNKYPELNINFSGELDDIDESLEAITLLFVMGVGLIYLILGTQFVSYWQPLLVLVTIPLAFTGVIFGLMVTNNPLSLYTLYGAVALAGISVNGAIVLISAANSRIEQGMSVSHAIVYAARRRVVPVIITSLTTIGGLFSLAAGFAGDSLVWGPVATAIVSGLFISTSMSLFTVPLCYRLAMTWLAR